MKTSVQKPVKPK